MPALTKNQQKWHNYLSAEAQRQRGTLAEHSSYPEFTLNCCGCFAELKTSRTKSAQEFIKDHQGHKAFSMEVNQFPNAPTYDRDKILAQVAKLGKYIAETHPKDGEVIRETRHTWLFIKNEGSIIGALKRLISIYEPKDSTKQILANPTAIAWAKALLDQDQKLIHFLEGNHGTNT